MTIKVRTQRTSIRGKRRPSAVAAPLVPGRYCSFDARRLPEKGSRNDEARGGERS